MASRLGVLGTSGGRSAGLGCLSASLPPDRWCCAGLAARAREIAAHRFLDAPQVSAAEMIATLGRRTGERCRGRRIIAVPATTEINFSGRDRARCGLGPAGDGKTPGFFMHA